MTAAIVLAGGLGTRMLPLTETTPKHLLPVGGHPLIAHLLHRLAFAGVTEVALATSYHADQFRPVLGDCSPWGVRLTHVREETPLGTGGAIAYAAQHLPAHDTFVVLNGDLLSGHDLGAQLAAAAGAGAGEFVLHVREVEDARPYGCVTLAAAGLGGAGSELRGVLDFTEKPEQPRSRLVNAGTYVLRRSALVGVPTDRPTSIERDVLPGLVARGAVAAYEESAYFLDVGSPTALLRASLAVGRGLVPGALPAAAGVRPDGSWVSPQAVVGAGARIERSLVLAGARVAEGDTLISTILTPTHRLPVHFPTKDG